MEGGQLTKLLSFHIMMVGYSFETPYSSQSGKGLVLLHRLFSAILKKKGGVTYGVNSSAYIKCRIPDSLLHRIIYAAEQINHYIKRDIRHDESYQ